MMSDAEVAQALPEPTIASAGPNADGAASSLVQIEEKRISQTQDDRLKRANALELARYLSNTRDSHVTLLRAHLKAEKQRMWRERFLRPDKDADILRRAKACYAEHVVTEPPVRSFLFSKPDGKSQYQCTLTWTPGIFSLSGDVGNRTLTHYQAANTLERGLNWLATNEFEYLMSKTDCQMSYDPEKSINFIVANANEEAFEARIEDLMEYRRFVKDTKNASTEFSAKFQKWATENGDVREQPHIDDFLPDRDNYDRTSKITKMDSYSTARYAREQGHSVPEGFLAWYRLWRALKNRYGLNVDPNCILTAKGRHSVRAALRSHIGEETPDSCAKLCSEIGLDDYYGCYSWPASYIYKIEAMQHGARMVLTEMTGKAVTKAAV